MPCLLSHKGPHNRIINTQKYMYMYVLFHHFSEKIQGCVGGWTVVIYRGWKFLVTDFFVPAKTSSWGLMTEKNVFFQKCSWGSETHAIFVFGGGDFGVFGAPHAPTRGSRGSENDTLLPMTMTCDWLKFWSGPAWRSKVIIRKPWRRKNKKKKNHKAFPALLLIKHNTS